MRILVVVLAAGCWRSPEAPEPLSNAQPPQVGLLTITTDHFGPLDAQSTATLGELRRVFAGYEVRPVNDGSLEYDVFEDTERLLFIVPNDDGSVFNVHATSPRVRVIDRGWRVGQAFRDARRIDACECWGENPTCYHRGEHVAVNFKRTCEGLTGGDHHGLRALDGIAVQRVIWSPIAFGGPAGDPE